MVISKFHGNQYHRWKMILIESKLEIYESTMRKPLLYEFESEKKTITQTGKRDEKQKNPNWIGWKPASL